jgi:hypothetical protein
VTGGRRGERVVQCQRAVGGPQDAGWLPRCLHQQQSSWHWFPCSTTLQGFLPRLPFHTQHCPC